MATEKDKGIQFAGFEDVEELPDSKQDVEVPQEKKTTSNERQASSPKSTTSSPSNKSYKDKNKKLNLGTVFAIVIVAGLLFVLTSTQKDNAKRTTPYNYSPPKSTNNYSPPKSTNLESKSTNINKSTALNRPGETKPVIGSSRVLTSAEVRYCLAEQVRLKSGLTIINNNSDQETRYINKEIADYDKRCKESRYYQSDYDSADLYITLYEDEIKEEGKQKFRRVLRTLRKDFNVIKVQELLTNLGYKPGPIDGLMGKRTRAAIRNYQSDIGVKIDGTPSKELLNGLNARLKKHNQNRKNLKSKSETTNIEKVEQYTTETQNNGSSTDRQKKEGVTGIPANARVFGSNWYCNEGYKKTGNKCVRVKAPANARVFGSNWYCNEGYKKTGNKCVRVKAPANARVFGSNWYCNEGYKKTGNKCVRVKAPANARVFGSNWYCNEGYKKTGNKCVSIFQ